jgi:hypothetical protein
MSATNREGLARGATGYQLDLALVRGEVGVANVTLDFERPTFRVRLTGMPIGEKGALAIRLPFDNALRLEARSPNPNAETASPCEQFDRLHCASSINIDKVCLISPSFLVRHAHLTKAFQSCFRSSIAARSSRALLC